MSISVPPKLKKTSSGEDLQLLAPGFSYKTLTSTSNQEVTWPVGRDSELADAVRITCDGDMWIRFGTTGQAASASLGLPWTFLFLQGTEMFSRPPGVTHINYMEISGSSATQICFTAMG